MSDGAASTLAAPAVPGAGSSGDGTPARTELERAVPMLRAFARRALGASDAIEDVVQETLVAGLAQLGSFRGHSRVSTWLVGILAHKIFDHFRATRRLTEPLAGDEPRDLLDAPPRRSPEGELARRQQLAIIETTLPSLPEYERMAVLLIDLQGVERAEVCATLGVTPAHLRVLLHRGRHRLRKAVELGDV